VGSFKRPLAVLGVGDNQPCALNVTIASQFVEGQWVSLKLGEAQEKQREPSHRDSDDANATSDAQPKIEFGRYPHTA
jgi:hypothetical protein